MVADRLLQPCAEQFRMQVVSLILRRLVFFFYLDAVGVGVGVLANALHLPGNFHVRLVGANGEPVRADLGSDDGLRGLSDHGQASVVAGDLLPRAQGFAVGRPPTASRIPQLQ